MTLQTLIFLIGGLIISCHPLSNNQENNRNSESIEKAHLSLYPETAELLDKNNNTNLGNSWKLIRVSDSACIIQWQKKKIIRRTKSEFDFFVARHFHLVWENDDFIALRTHTGSNAWFEIYLPLDTSSEEIFLENPIAFDIQDNLVVCSNFSKDTVLKVVNLKTRFKQAIVEKTNKCNSEISHNCIDSLSVSKTTLYYRWITPDRFINKSFTEKRIKIKV